MNNPVINEGPVGGLDLLTLNGTDTVTIKFNETFDIKSGDIGLKPDPTTIGNYRMTMSIEDANDINHEFEIDEAGDILLPVTDTDKFVNAPLLGTDANRRLIVKDPSSVTVGVATDIEGGLENDVVYKTSETTTGFIGGAPFTTLTRNNEGVPVFTAAVKQSENLVGGVAQAIAFQTATNSTGFLTGTSNSLLARNSTNNLEFTPNATAVVGTATNLEGGGAQSIAFQTAPNSTSFLTGAADSLLARNSTNNLEFTPNSTVVVGTATNLEGGSSGSIPYQTASNTTSYLPLGLTDYLLMSDGTTPIYKNPLDITVKKSLKALSLDKEAQAGVVVHNLANITTVLTYGTSGSVLTSIGNGATFTAQADLIVGKANSLNSGASGSLPYQTAAGNTAFKAIGGTDFILRSSGTEPVWSNPTTVKVGGLLGGSQGSIVYQTASDITGLLTIGGNDSILTSNGSNPVWENSSSVSVGEATKATNLTGVTPYSIPFQLAPNVTQYILPPLPPPAPTPTPLTPFMLGFTSLIAPPIWIAAATLTVAASATALTAGSAATATYASSAGSATNIAGGAANDLVYQTGAGQTFFLGGDTLTTLQKDASGNIRFETNPLFAPVGDGPGVTIMSSGDINGEIVIKVTRMGTNDNIYFAMRPDTILGGTTVKASMCNEGRGLDVASTGAVYLPPTDNNRYINAPFLGTDVNGQLINPQTLDMNGGNETININCTTAGNAITMTGQENMGIKFTKPGLSTSYVYFDAGANAIKLRIDTPTRELSLFNTGIVRLPSTATNRYISAPLLKTDASGNIDKVTLTPQNILKTDGTGSVTGISGPTNSTLQMTASGPVFVQNPTIDANSTTDALTITSPGTGPSGHCLIRLSQTTRNRNGYFYLGNSGASDMNLNLQLYSGTGVQRILTIEDAGVVTLPTTTDNRYSSAPILSTDASGKITRRNLNNYRNYVLSANSPWPNNSVTTIVNWVETNTGTGTALGTGFNNGQFQNNTGETIVVNVSLSSKSVNNGFGEREFHIVHLTHGRLARHDVRGVDEANVSTTVLLLPFESFILQGYQNSGVGLDFDSGNTYLTISWVG